jgi:metallophosphoesterase superfamily enzyme
LSALKYVCLSDLHLGADYSVLTRMDDEGKTNLLKPSATLDALGTALRQYVPAVSDTEHPTLILLGDVLDLGLSSTGAVAQAFKRFIEALFPAQVQPVFSTQVLCVPGNHDHHLWRTAQDQLVVVPHPVV